KSDLFRDGAGQIKIAKLRQAFEVFQTLIADAARKHECLQLGQPLQVCQTSVGDTGGLKAERLKLRQSLEVRNAGVADSADELQFTELGERLEILHARVRDLRNAEVGRSDFLKVWQRLEMHQDGISAETAEDHFGKRVVRVRCIDDDLAALFFDRSNGP